MPDKYKVILNGKACPDVKVIETGDERIPYGLETKKGLWSLVRNAHNQMLLGVVNHGSIKNHKFRGYGWFKQEGQNLIGY